MEFKVQIRRRIREWLDRLSDRIDLEYRLQGVPKRVVEKDTSKDRTKDRERRCPVCGRVFRGIRELCQACRRKK